MVAIEKIRPTMFAEIYSSFLKDDDPRSTENDWKMLFAPSMAKEEIYGYALTNAARIVGILGTCFSSRIIGGEKKRFCNLHSWFVNQEHRGHSLMLMRPVLRLADHTITDFTPTAQVCEISKRLGFKELDSTAKILLPFRTKKNDEGISWHSTFDKAEIANRLSDADRILLKDHGGNSCCHMLISNGSEYCYIIYSRVERHRIPYCYIHYLSNKPMFSRLQGGVRAMLMEESRTNFIAVDARLVAEIDVPRSFNLPIMSRQLYKSTTIAPNRIDNLYSELIFLNLCTFPSLSYHLKCWIGSWYNRSTRKPVSRDHSKREISYPMSEPENAR